MANGKRELIEDISDIRRLAGLSEAPKKAAPAAANPDPNNYGSFSTNNNSPYGFAQGGSSDDTNANFFASDKRMRDAQAQQAAPTPKAAAPAPKAVAPKPAGNTDDIKAFQRAHGLTPDGIAGPKTKAAGYGSTSTFDREGPSPVAYNTNPLPGPKSPVNPEGPQAADLSRPGSDDPLKNYTLPPGVSGGATNKAPGFGTNITPKAAEPEPQSITNQPKSTDNFKPVQTPPDYKSPTLTQPKSTFNDPRPPKDIVNPMDQYRQKPSPQSDMAPTVDNAKRLPPQINPSAPKLDTTPFTKLPSQTYRDQPNTDDGVLRIQSPALDKALNNFQSTTTPIGPNPNKFELPAAPAPKPEKQVSNDYGLNNAWKLTADKDPDTMKDIVKELRQMAGIPEDGIPGKGMAQEAMAQFESKGKKPDFLDVDKDGDEEEPMTKALDDKEEKVEEGIEVNPINDSLTLMKRLAGI